MLLLPACCACLGSVGTKHVFRTINNIPRIHRAANLARIAAEEAAREADYQKKQAENEATRSQNAEVLFWSHFKPSVCARTTYTRTHSHTYARTHISLSDQL